MATQAQILANRSNAKKSTGPRTAEGKTVVAQNAVKHGLCGHETVIAGEDLGEFEFYRERMFAELDPVGELESGLAERIVGLSWRLKRAGKLQAVAFDSLYARQKHSPCESSDSKRDIDGDSTFGRALVRDFADCRVLDRLLMYERRIEHSLYRTMAELKRHRILQEVGPGQMWELRRALASEDDAGGVSSLKWEVPSGKSETPHTPAANLQRSDSEPTHDGVVTNASEEVQEGNSSLQTSNFPLQTTKTKPISPATDRGQVPSKTVLTADSLRNGPARTKPISGAGEVSSLKFQVSSDDSSLHTSNFKLPASPGDGAAGYGALGLYRQAGAGTIPAVVQEKN